MIFDYIVFHKISGFYQFEQVLDGGDSSHRIKLDTLRKEIEPSDTINIQYTSVN